MELAVLLQLPLLLVVAYALFATAAHGDWVFDDVATILANQDILNGNWKPTIFGASTASEWRGPVRASWALGMKIWGPPPEKLKQGMPVPTYAFHMGNIVLHAFNAWIVTQILGTLGFDYHLSLLGGLIFVGHPLAVSSVAYMSSRGVLLSALFGFLAIWAVLAGYEFLAVPALALAFLCKEDAALITVALAVLCVLQGSPWFAFFGVLPVGIACWKWTAIKELLANNGEKGLNAIGFEETLKQPHYSRTSFAETVLRYPFWLVGVSLCNDPDIQAVSLKRFVLALVVMLGLTATFFMAPLLIQQAIVLTCITPLALYWFFVMPDPVMEYRAYISLLGAVIFLTLLASALPIWLVWAAISALWALTGFRVFDYCNAEAFWTGCLRDGAEKARPLINLGAAHQLRNDLEGAKPYYQRALKLNPNLGVPLANLGIIAAAQKDVHAAKEYFEAATVKCPLYAQAWHFLGQTYQQMKDEANAQRCYAQAAAVSAKG